MLSDEKKQQIYDYQTFEDKGHHTKVIPPNGYKKMRLHFVFDVKMMADTKQDW
jgi:hypothetical protein